MSIGSGLFSTARAAISHLVHPGGGLAGEIWDVRKDVTDTLAPVAAITVEEYTNVVGSAAPGAAALLDAAASVAAPVTVLKAAMKVAGLAQLALCPRALTITTAGTTPADAPATAAVTGKDALGAAQTETLTVAQTATSATTTKIWSDITSVVYPAAEGTGATMSIGVAAAQLKAATATVASAVTLAAADLFQGMLSTDAPRALVFTVAGTTPADAPATATVVGKDANGGTHTEVVTLPQTATTATTKYFWSYIASVAYPAADGTGATVAIGISAAVGLKKKAKTRAGLTGCIREIAGGSVVTNGVLTAPSTTGLPNGNYAPNATFDGATDFAIYYEFDATAK
jgi:hypothetical protein